MWDALSDRPHLESLRAFFDRLMAVDGERVEFVVLYGSMARGDWGRGSDYDVFVGLREDQAGRQIDRLQQFDVHSDGRIEPLSFSPLDLAKMLATFNPILLAALRDGIVLFDRGTWQKFQGRYRALLDSGHLVRLHRGWRWTTDGPCHAAAPL